LTPLGRMLLCSDRFWSTECSNAQWEVRAHNLRLITYWSDAMVASVGLMVIARKARRNGLETHRPWMIVDSGLSN